MIASLLLAAGIPAAVQAASDLQRKDARGVMAYLAETEGTFKTPISATRTRTRSWIVAVDGDPRRSVVLAITIDGRTGTEAERAKAQADAEAGYADPKRQLYPPYDKRHIHDYRFAPAPGGPGEQAFAFESPIMDERHGKGTFTIAAGNRVRKLQFTPNRFPAPAREGGLTLTRALVQPGWWSMVGLQVAFSGGFGPLSGGLNLAQRASGHRRFATVEAALAAAPKP
jgi:hypothetical protein